MFEENLQTNRITYLTDSLILHCILGHARWHPLCSQGVCEWKCH